MVVVRLITDVVVVDAEVVVNQVDSLSELGDLMDKSPREEEGLKKASEGVVFRLTNWVYRGRE